ncbi:MAG TPA: GtrA family protein [Streptosporangiaceae bacterium]|nr:GtrA family protein [Streptosporangiaceae bacterium]
MNLVNTVYRRFRLLIHEGAKFLVIGGIGFVVTIGGADILHFDVGLGKYTSITVAMIIATVVTFLGNRYWTFAHREGKGASHETVVFFVLNGVGLLIQYACIGAIQDVMGLQGKLWYTVANLIGTAIGTVFRFWSYRKWVWHAQPASSEAADMEAGPAGLLNGSPEARQPVLVPSDDRAFRLAPGGPVQQNGYQAQPNGRADQSGQGRPDGPRHARSR